MGSRATWPEGLRAAAAMVLEADKPMALLWGGANWLLCNDAFAPLIGADADSPAPLFDLRPDLTTSVMPPLAATRRGQSAILRLPVAEALRASAPLHHDLILSPLCDETSAVAGALVTCLSKDAPAEGPPVLRDMAAYRTLFESIDQGFCLAEILFAPDGKPCDYRFLETNSAFAHHTGLIDAVGRTALELVPNLEREWIEMYASVASTGRSIRREYEAEPMGRLFDLFAARVGGEESRVVAIVFRDITERKAREMELRESNARKAFLLTLSDLICGPGDPDCVQLSALRLLGEHLAVDRVAWFDTADESDQIGQNYHNGVASLQGCDPVSLMGTPAHARFADGHMVICSDTQADPSLPKAAISALEAVRVRAFVGVPYFRAGRLTGGIVLHQAQLRRWTKAELTLIAEAAERIWPAIEQARAEAALRGSEEKFRQLAELAPSIVWMADADGTISYVSDQWHSFAGNDPDETSTGPVALFLHPDDKAQARQAWEYAKESGEPFEMELRNRRQDSVYRWCLTRAHAQRGPDGSIACWFGTTTDIDDQKRTEEALRKSEKRQALLLSLVDALRQSAPLPAQKEACRLLAEHLQVDRAFFAELDEPTGKIHVAQDHFHPRLSSVAGSYRADSFGSAMAQLRKGERFEVGDMRTHSAIPAFVKARFLAGQIAACLCIPIILGGRMAGAVCVTAREARAWTEADAELLAEAGQRIWAAVAQTRAETAQRATDTRFRTLVEGMPQLVWRAATSGRWTWASPQWSSFTGLSDAQSQSAGWLDALHPEDRTVAEVAWSRARELGKFEADYRLRDHATGTYRWFQTRALPVRDQAGHPVEWLGTSTDVQDLHDMQERLRSLVAELQHRTRNLMAVVMAVTDRTMATSQTLEDFRPVIQSRLGSITRTSGLLSKLRDDGQITFDELLDSVFVGNGIIPAQTLGLSLSGPKGIRLRSSSVQTLALALHELAARAQSEGGLSQPGGTLAVVWGRSQETEGDARLSVDWKETFTALPATSVPTGDQEQMSFGQELIERGLPYQLNAETTFRLTDTGLSCQIVLPLAPSGG